MIGVGDWGGGLGLQRAQGAFHGLKAVATSRLRHADALKSSRGNRSQAARLLSTTERVISYKVKKYGIDPARLRG